MKPLICALSILVLIAAPIAAQPQIIDSPQAAILLQTQQGLKSIDRQSYVVQLGYPEVQTEAQDGRAELEMRALIATGEKDYPVTVGDIYTLLYSSEVGPVSISLTVPHGGRMRVPGFGTFVVEGKTFAQLKEEIEDVVLRYYPYGDPVLSIQSTGVFLVDVTGESRNSTKVEAWGLSRLSSVISNASEAASTRKVTVVSRDGVSRDYDLYEVLREGNGTDPLLSAGDRVIFSKRGTEITISGNVNRPGTYQIDAGETLDQVIDRYAHGAMTSADISSISIVRYVNGERSERKVKKGDGVALSDGDVISIFPAELYLGSVTVEGALSDPEATAAARVGGQAAIKLFFRFAEGERVRDLVEAMSSYFSASSDLADCYLIRDGVSTPISFSDILYGNSSAGEMELKNSDRFVIPFSQNFVTVNGAVNSTGTYGYVPGRTAQYYIGLAGGMSAQAKSSRDYTITDKNGNALEMDAVVPAEAVIEVTRDNFVTNLQPTVAVVSLTAGILGIVATSLAILLPHVY